MRQYDWKKALDYILYVASQQGISQGTLAENVISLSHFNKMCNGKENVKAEIVFQCADKLGITSKKILEVASNQENLQFIQFQEQLDEILLLQKYQELPKLKQQIDQYKNIDKYFTQLYYRVCGLIESILNKNYQLAIVHFVTSLKTAYPKLKIEEEIPRYFNEMDIDIISAIALCYKNQQQYEFAIEIYKSILKFIDRKQISTYLFPKTCYNLARALEKEERYSEELKYVDIGLEFSSKHQIYTHFGYLYYARAVAQYYLGIDNKESFDYCIYHYRLQGRNQNFIQSIEEERK